ncbi:hypothetical protein S7711_11286 [Stachybotrys chartarum IBT 7711]|uniref:NAD-dependent epimerase/dehydratase domain-containing protein n=1 Tax=Stachybotrys chartarum (strain CBS 109288 / IBT 7711) TaxID=1280523 RepID=A0A084AWX8_STACB|nr:hypothetical protein S7711_11286 [Stachybotrys chartarum IBT 7711]KFA51260.1 hypothetical protein S40293_10891 [Stachybotrys chartarum IBT 40293]
MRLLVFDDADFASRLCVHEALSRGHDVTVFSPEPRPAPGGVAVVVGDRLRPSDLSQLDSKSFHTVIDAWQGDPVGVKSALQALSPRIQHYIYISSINVYNTKDASGPITEDSPLWELAEAPPQLSKNKVGGEINALRSGVPTTLVRCGHILGPREDPGGGLSSWLRRLDKGGPTLAPGSRDAKLQYVDSRDFAEFVINAAEKKKTGPFNVIHTTGHTTWSNFLETANHITGDKAQLHWLGFDKIVAAGIQARKEIPLWLSPESHAVFDASKASAAGLRTRPASDTIADTWAWMKDSAQSGDGSCGVGLDPDKEVSVLREHFGAQI